MTFVTTLLLEGKTATGIVVPDNYVELLGGGKRPPVLVTLAGRYTYRSTIMPYAGQPMLPVAGEHREAAGLTAGQEVVVTLVLDTQPRVVELPADLAAALQALPPKLAAFDHLSPSAKKAHVESVNQAKTAETRSRRIEKVLAALFFTLVLGCPLWAQDFLAADVALGVPVGVVPGQGPWPAFRVEYDLAPSPWGFELGYAYRGKQYYNFDHATDTWEGPFPWALISSGSVDEPDWPFYQTRHVLSPGVVFRADRSWVQPRLSLGLLAQFFFSGKADQYYPEYLSEFQRFQGQVDTLFGNYLKFGLEGLVWQYVTLGIDFAFEVPDWSQFYTAIQKYPVLYAQTNAHFELRLGGRL